VATQNNMGDTKERQTDTWSSGVPVSFTSLIALRGGVGADFSCSRSSSSVPWKQHQSREGCLSQHRVMEVFPDDEDTHTHTHTQVQTKQKTRERERDVYVPYRTLSLLRPLVRLMGVDSAGVGGDLSSCARSLLRARVRRIGVGTGLGAGAAFLDSEDRDKGQELIRVEKREREVGKREEFGVENPSV
jgi:hypothetical protein